MPKTSRNKAQAVQDLTVSQGGGGTKSRRTRAAAAAVPQAVKLRRTARRHSGGMAVVAAAAAAAAAVLEPPGGAPEPGKQPASPLVPGATQGLRALAALGVEQGVFVVVAASAALGAVQAFTRYVDQPLPGLVPAHKDAYLQMQRVGGATVYIAYVPWPKAPEGLLTLGCLTATGRKPVFTVDCVPLHGHDRGRVTGLLRRYGRLLAAAFEAVLVPSHPLRLALAASRRPRMGAPGQSSSAAPKAAPPPKVAPATVRGHFDGVVDQQAHGWAFDVAQPTRRVAVEVVCGGEVVAAGVAERLRDDLQAKGIGDGRHHFRLTLSSELFDGRPHELQVRVADTGWPLGGTAVATLPARTPGAVDLMPRAQVVARVHALAQRAQVRHPQAVQVLLHAVRTAALQQETGLPGLARAGYERLLGIVGADALLHSRIAETWLQDGNAVAAERACRTALALDARFAWALLTLGNALLAQARAQEAQEAYAQAVALAPDCAPARARLVRVRGSAEVERAEQLERQGNREAAAAVLTAVLIDEPDHPQARMRLDALLRQASPVPVPTAAAAVPTALQAGSVEEAATARRLLDAVLDEAERRLAAAASRVQA